jgi:hypothetical protein
MRSAVSAINSGWDRREYDHNLRGRGLEGGGGGGEGGGGVLWSYDTGRFDTSREALPHWEQSSHPPLLFPPSPFVHLLLTLYFCPTTGSPQSPSLPSTASFIFFLFHCLLYFLPLPLPPLFLPRPLPSFFSFSPTSFFIFFLSHCLLYFLPLPLPTYRLPSLQLPPLFSSSSTDSFIFFLTHCLL